MLGPKPDEVIELRVNMRHRLVKDLLVGQCREFPFIIVKGKSLESLREQLFKHLEVYFNTFSEEGKRVLTQFGKIVEVRNGTSTEIVEDAEWTQQEELLTIPIKH